VFNDTMPPPWTPDDSLMDTTSETCASHQSYLNPKPQVLEEL